MTGNHILIVDDEPLTRQSLYEILKFEGYRVTTANDGREALKSIEKLPPQIVIADLKMPGMDGLGLLREIKAKGWEIAVILITAYGSIETAVDAMREGAFDYITKPIVDSEIKIVIEKILNQRRLMEENRFLRERLAATTRSQFHNIIGQNLKMQKIYTLIESIANTNATVLLCGESGTGKRLIAHAIHHSDSSRHNKPFIEVSCGALPETLLESELFGHVKGSFTSAIRDRKGRFELANDGTIFLDEIDAFSPSLQVKLLRVLQNGEFERVGDTHTIKINVRVIAATNQDLKESIKKGTFREDLYYRLNVIFIHIPPLRERKDDIPLLVEHLLNKYNQRDNNKKVSSVSEETMQSLMEYDWPGNVRELENVIERSVILSKEKTISRESLPDFLQKTEGLSRSSGLSKAEITDDTGTGIDTSIGIDRSAGSLKEALKNSESQIIRHTLEQVSWNRKQAAENLGINRTTLYNKMKEYGLLDKKSNG